MPSGLILPDTPEIREYVQKRNAEIAEASGETLRERHKERLESNSEYQQRKMMSRDEKYRGAIETLVKARMTFYQSMGVEKTEDEVRREMIEMVVKKYARDHGIE